MILHFKSKRASSKIHIELHDHCSVRRNLVSRDPGLETVPGFTTTVAEYARPRNEPISAVVTGLGV